MTRHDVATYIEIAVTRDARSEPAPTTTGAAAAGVSWDVLERPARPEPR